MLISVCIATYRRPERLRALLADLVGQELLPFEIVVVDNDAEASAREIVEERRRLASPPGAEQRRRIQEAVRESYDYRVIAAEYWKLFATLVAAPCERQRGAAPA
jgi:glycosyltransferase involved in cell wall biosynthesis